MDLEHAGDGEFDQLVFQPVPIEPFEKHKRPGFGFTRDVGLILQRRREKGLYRGTDGRNSPYRSEWRRIGILAIVGKERDRGVIVQRFDRLQKCLHDSGWGFGCVSHGFVAFPCSSVEAVRRMMAAIRAIGRHPR